MASKFVSVPLMLAFFFNILISGQPAASSTVQLDVSTTVQPPFSTTVQPAISDQSAVPTTVQPAVSTSDQVYLPTTVIPAVSSTDQSAMSSTVQPAVSASDKPAVITTVQPAVSSTDQPAMPTIVKSTVATTIRQNVPTTIRPVGPTTIQPVVPTTVLQDCVDKVDCRRYGSNACSEKFEAWSRDNCPKHCGYCTECRILKFPNSGSLSDLFRDFTIPVCSKPDDTEHAAVDKEPTTIRPVMPTTVLQVYATSNTKPNTSAECGQILKFPKSGSLEDLFFIYDASNPNLYNFKRSGSLIDLFRDFTSPACSKPEHAEDETLGVFAIIGIVIGAILGVGILIVCVGLCARCAN